MALAIGSSLLVTACGGGGKGDFSNASLVTMNTTSVPPGATGQPYEAQLSATFPNPPGQYFITAGRLPPGVELDPITGVISGFPRQLGRFNFDVSARDGVDPALPVSRDTTFAEAVRSYALDVTLGPPNILPQAVPSAQYRRSFLYQIDVAGGTPPYTFTLLSGTLPAGISLSQTGRLGSFPTQANVAPGVPFEFDVEVRDANNQTDTAHFTLSVVVLPLIIETTTLNEAAQNFPFQAQFKLASTGGGQPITWTQAPPVGAEVELSAIGMAISADGLLQNSLAFPGPTTVGSHSFTIQVTDEAGQVSTRRFTLKVNPGPFLTSITPNRAALPGPYIVSGGNFQPGAILVFKPGLTEVTVTPTFVSSSQLRFNTPPIAPGGGAVAVKVINPDTGAYTKPAAFVFMATTIAFGSKGFLTSNVSSKGLDCADVNGDGYADVIHAGASGIQTYSGSPSSSAAGLIYHRNLGTASPTFASLTLDAGNFYDCAFADVNNDGKLDVVALGQTQIKAFLNGVGSNPLGTFSTAVVSTHASGFSYPAQMTLGLLNTDGVIDLAFGVAYLPGSFSSGRCYTMTGNGSGGFTLVSSATSTMTSQYGVPALCSGDSNGDGRDEVLAGIGFASNYQGPMLNYNAGNSDGSFSTWQTRGKVTSPYYYGTVMGMVVGDFLGTGEDVVLSNMAGFYQYASGSALHMYSGASYTTFTVLSGTSALPKTMGSVDADFDAKLDWAISTKPSTIEVYRGSTKLSVLTLDASVGTPSVSSPMTGRVASGDINNDGRADLLVTTSSWICEGMGSVYGSYYANGISGDGGTKGVVFYLNTSN